MIEFENISKEYNGSKVVNIKNLQLFENNIYGLIGSNGAGKTTTIKMLIGLLKATTGTIKINGVKVSGEAVDIKRIIGYIPDVPNLYDNLTGIEHITFIANLYGYDSNIELEQKILEYADIFEVKEKLYELIETYSKGTRQKISIISALIHKPEILILDEPFSGLVPIVIKKFKVFLKKYIETDKNLVIFSTHDLDVASDICSDIIVLNRGEILFNNKIEEILKENSLENTFFDLINKERELKC